MHIHPYFRVLPRVRLYVAKPMRAGCISSTSAFVLILGALVWLFAIIGVRSLFGQVDAVARLHGTDLDFRVANPTPHSLSVTIQLYRDSTLTDTVAARISPASFTLLPGGEQVVRLRLHAKPESGARYRLTTLFQPVEKDEPPRPTMRFVLATRIITRVEAGP